MTRIIGGEHGGRRLATPPGDGTRPTSDRVREALFSALDAALGSLHGLRFLDLYAGSGAVGLEARSRGAGWVTLVEQDRRAASVITGNARSLAMTSVEVLTTAVARAVERPPAAPYDVVFADPPYAVPGEELEALLRVAAAGGWLAPGAVVVLERPSRGPRPTWPDGLREDRSRRYGETTLWYGHATD